MNILQTTFFYNYRDRQNYFYMKVLLCGFLCIYKRDISSEEATEPVPAKTKVSKDNENKKISLAENFRRLFLCKNILEKGILRSIKLRQFFCTVEYGGEDPALTGWLTGIFHTLKPLLLRRLDKYFSLSREDVYIKWQPSFQDQALAIELKAVFAVKAWRLLKYFGKTILLKVR